MRIERVLIDSRICCHSGKLSGMDDEIRKALEFYADSNIYKPDTIHGGYIAVLADRGHTAYNALRNAQDLDHKEILMTDGNIESPPAPKLQGETQRQYNARVEQWLQDQHDTHLEKWNIKLNTSNAYEYETTVRATDWVDALLDGVGDCDDSELDVTQINVTITKLRRD